MKLTPLTLKMTLNNQNNIRYGMPSQNCMTKEALHMFLALLVKNGHFAYLTLKMTLNHANNTRNELPGQNHMKMRHYICS